MARLRLARSSNVGPRTYAHLMRRFASARRALEALPSLAATGGRAGYTACPEAEAQAELAAGAAAGARLAILGEPDYPPLLAEIDQPPPVLWLIGDAGVFRRPAIAIVGARNASALGLRAARNLARGLGAAGHVVVSGLARGIDAAAHEAALASGTVAVLAGGIDRVYPPENAGLAARIAAAGALVSECPMGTEPTARHFPRRNRLVSGLARGVLVIEAAVRSGSLITARCALEQGREAMACPGGPEDPRAGGANQLIREGAALIRSVDDVLEALAAPRTLALAEPGGTFLFDEDFFDAEIDEPDPDDLEDLEAGSAREAALTGQIMRLIGTHPVELDELARLCGAAPAEISLAVLELDLAGRVELLPGGTIARSTLD
ncbi:MAG TPA: DNA-processing protein DprA [Thermohalobaculum sp.]|nr:DNA-processing protein DprA [Thermohalobaculum sp.]